ncbi:Alpha/Beta hydrolase protein [Mycena filopes]|nr:Alpha/Beta hydrolase protein [Mycena filopes]
MPKLLLLAALAFTAVAGQQPSVTIKNGTVRNSSFGVLDATAYGPHCWSRFTTGFDDNSGFNNSEDCLTLNVIRPTGASPKSLVPVVVWIHGGGLTTGGSADFRYNGSWIVEASIANGKPIVFVSINYRLASLGFLAGKALESEGSLNLGVRDQRLALHWVQENISLFGGNPKCVVSSGKSRHLMPMQEGDHPGRKAGATSVHTQTIAYAGRDDKLFNQVIAESGTNGGNFSLADSTSLQANYDALLANTTCASTVNSSSEAQLSCIRALPIDEFRRNSVGDTDIVFDGDFINVPGTFEAYRTGKWVKVAFIVGSNTDEGRSFAPSGANTTADVVAQLAGTIPSQFINRILQLYPDVPSLGCPFNTGDFQLGPESGTPGAQNKRVAAIVGDEGMAAGPRWLAQEVSSQVPFYKYRFNHKPYSVTFSTLDYIGHFLEVSYVFNLQNNDTAFWLTNHFTATYLGPTAPIEDRFLGVYMSRAWASFIATGDPNNANVPSKIPWPKYSDGQQNMVWQTQGSATERDNYRQEGMQFIIDNVFF